MDEEPTQEDVEELARKLDTGEELTEHDVAVAAWVTTWEASDCEAEEF